MTRLRPAINPQPQCREVIPARFLIGNIVVWAGFLAAFWSAIQ